MPILRLSFHPLVEPSIIHRLELQTDPRWLVIPVSQQNLVVDWRDAGVGKPGPGWAIVDIDCADILPGLPIIAGDS